MDNLSCTTPGEIVFHKHYEGIEPFRGQLFVPLHSAAFSVDLQLLTTLALISNNLCETRIKQGCDVLPKVISTTALCIF